VPFYRFQRNVWVTANIDGTDHHVIPDMWNPDTQTIRIKWPTAQRITIAPGQMPPAVRRREVDRGDYIPDDDEEFNQACEESTPKTEAEADLAATFDNGVRGMRDRGLDAGIADVLLKQPQEWKARAVQGEPIEDVVSPYLDDVMRQALRKILYE
jgi:hypothetical protein